MGCQGHQLLAILFLYQLGVIYPPRMWAWRLVKCIWMIQMGIVLKWLKVLKWIFFLFHWKCKQKDLPSGPLIHSNSLWFPFPDPTQWTHLLYVKYIYNTHMSVGVGIFSSKNGTDFKNSFKISHYSHLFIQLRRLG